MEPNAETPPQPVPVNPLFRPATLDERLDELERCLIAHTERHYREREQFTFILVGMFLGAALALHLLR